MAAISRSIGLCLRTTYRNKLGITAVPVRWLNLQEYQSKKLMEDHGINIQKFKVATTPDEAEKISKTFKVNEYVIKAQILAGGRGKGTFDHGFKGGVHLTKNPEEVPKIVKEMLGHKLVTKQTKKGGVLVKTVMVAQALDIARETYLAILMDRAHSGPVMVGSPYGGMDIEEVAAKDPNAIFTDPIDINKGITDAQARKMAENLQFKGPLLDEAATQIKRLYELFTSVDATQVEINPFGETPDGQVVCFDAKINFDDNAKYRQQEIFAMEDISETDVREIKAASYNLNYIGMEGNIGCLVNGAGLAMATMDIIKLHGGEPANFLDVGGGVTEKQVHEAFKIITSDEQVKAILVNVFGGIVDCATIANGVVNACKGIQLKLPLVVRLEGTNVKGAKDVLESSNLPIVMADNFEDAAQKVVASIK